MGGGVFREPFLLDAALDAVARDGIEAVDEEDAIEVIDLVLEHAGQQAPAVKLHGMAIDVLGLDVHPLRARDLGEDPGNRKTALFRRHLASAVAVARHHPGVVVLHEGGLEPKPGLDNLGTYWGSVYEPVYEAGIAAGAASRTGRLGFVAAFPIPATYNNVNAFTLGARSVNPDATTHVRFTGDWCNPEKQAEAADGLIAGGVDVLTQHQDCTATVLRAADRAGVRSVGYHYDGSEVAPKGWLVGSVWDWRRLFVDIVRTISTRHFVESPYNGDFRGGLRTGNNPFVLTELSPSAAPGTAERIAAAEASLRAGHSPFDGPLTDREGKLRVPAGVTPSQAAIERMDWWVPGVVGDAQ